MIFGVEYMYVKLDSSISMVVACGIPPSHMQRLHSLVV